MYTAISPTANVMRRQDERRSCSSKKSSPNGFVRAAGDRREPVELHGEELLEQDDGPRRSAGTAKKHEADHDGRRGACRTGRHLRLRAADHPQRDRAIGERDQLGVGTAARCVTGRRCLGSARSDTGFLVDVRLAEVAGRDHLAEPASRSCTTMGLLRPMSSRTWSATSSASSAARCRRRRSRRRPGRSRSRKKRGEERSPRTARR